MTNQNSSKPSERSIWAVIPAAGSGSRMGGEVPKQYLQLGSKTILEHSIERLAQVGFVKGVVVAINEQDRYWPELNLEYDIPVHAVIGGQQRMHSVFSALKWLKSELKFDACVLVHDAARPCVRKEDIYALIDRVGSHSDGGILAIPLADTLKRGAEGRIMETVSRENLWQAQTPQLFPLLTLYNALHQVIDEDILVTDEAQAMERAGYKPLLVAGHTDNIKVTHKQDIQLAERYIKDQMR